MDICRCFGAWETLVTSYYPPRLSSAIYQRVLIVSETQITGIANAIPTEAISISIPTRESVSMSYPTRALKRISVQLIASCVVLASGAAEAGTLAALNHTSHRDMKQ